jgi:hypothetical protein
VLPSRSRRVGHGEQRCTWHCGRGGLDGRWTSCTTCCRLVTCRAVASSTTSSTATASGTCARLRLLGQPCCQKLAPPTQEMRRSRLRTSIRPTWGYRRSVATTASRYIICVLCSYRHTCAFFLSHCQPCSVCFDWWLVPSTRTIPRCAGAWHLHSSS